MMPSRMLEIEPPDRIRKVTSKWSGAELGRLKSLKKDYQKKLLMIIIEQAERGLRKNHGQISRLCRVQQAQRLQQVLEDCN